MHRHRYRGGRCSSPWGHFMRQACLADIQLVRPPRVRQSLLDRTTLNASTLRTATGRAANPSGTSREVFGQDRASASVSKVGLPSDRHLPALYSDHLS